MSDRTPKTRSFAICAAHVLEIPADQVPPASELSVREWLAQHGVGAVYVVDGDAFAWPGRFLGRLRDTGEWVVMFGVPPAVLYDPVARASGSVGLDAAVVIAPHQLGQCDKTQAATAGTVEIIALATHAEAPMHVVASAQATAGHGLEGDRYADGNGTFSQTGGRGHDLTFIEAEAIDALAEDGIALAPEDARRNVVTRGTDLDALIGRRFRVGEVVCLGRRRCEPCAHLHRVTKPGVLAGLVHRGGLRADVLIGGTIHTGDRIERLP